MSAQCQLVTRCSSARLSGDLPCNERKSFQSGAAVIDNTAYLQTLLCRLCHTLEYVRVLQPSALSSRDLHPSSPGSFLLLGESPDLPAQLGIDPGLGPGRAQRRELPRGAASIRKTSTLPHSPHKQRQQAFRCATAPASRVRLRLSIPNGIWSRYG